ncbi:C40 family peptidase [Kamptonema formosum]|uniref:C40 family peptidase n=1 Tax=Kamptonema formosum TaxID=331992 RepID=UPI0003451AD0|nr:C40 family peptidase [Oscillatoria sp. PCC 10802]
MILRPLHLKKAPLLAALLPFALAGCVSKPALNKPAAIPAQPALNKPAAIPAQPPLNKPAAIQTFVKTLQPQMSELLQQELKRRQVDFQLTPQTQGNAIRLSAPSWLDRETVWDVRIEWDNNVPVLKGKVLTKQQRELIEKVAAESFKNTARLRVEIFPYEGVGLDYGITVKPYSNLYVQPKEEAGGNLATQVRLGTPVKLLEYSADKQFVRVRIEDDGYIAWIPRRDIMESEPATFEEWVKSPKLTLANTIKQPQEVYFGTRLKYIPVKETDKTSGKSPDVLGAVIPAKSAKPEAMPVIQLKRQDVSLNPATAGRPALIEIAKQFLPKGKQGGGTYLWGGAVGKNLDCSGYTQTVFRAGNIYLPRDADQQQLYTQPVAETLQKIDLLRPGDLVFFSQNRKYATHVGIYIGNYQFIHSSTKGGYSGVKISALKGGGDYDNYLQEIYFGGGRVGGI